MLVFLFKIIKMEEIASRSFDQFLFNIPVIGKVKLRFNPFAYQNYKSIKRAL